MTIGLAAAAASGCDSTMMEAMAPLDEAGEHPIEELMTRAAVKAREGRLITFASQLAKCGSITSTRV